MQRDVSGRHARYYDTRTQAVIAWLCLLAVSAWCRLRPRVSRHEPGAGMLAVAELTRVKRSFARWPDGADLDYAEELHSMQDTVVMPEVRA